MKMCMARLELIPLTSNPRTTQEQSNHWAKYNFMRLSAKLCIHINLFFLKFSPHIFLGGMLGDYTAPMLASPLGSHAGTTKRCQITMENSDKS